MPGLWSILHARWCFTSTIVPETIRVSVRADLAVPASAMGAERVMTSADDPWAHLQNGAWASFYAHAVGWVVVLALIPIALVWLAYATAYKIVTGDSP